MVALGESCNQELTHQTWRWLGVVAAVIVTTVQMQDSPDRRGDVARGRKTMPLVYGEELTRWISALPVICWSFVCPMLWKVAVVGYIAPVSMGVLLGIRIIRCRPVAADQLSWKLWCWWMATLLVLPIHVDFDMDKTHCTM